MYHERIACAIGLPLIRQDCHENRGNLTHSAGLCGVKPPLLPATGPFREANAKVTLSFVFSYSN